MNTLIKDSSGSRRFSIALPSSGGEQGKARVFYDAWHESKVIGYGSNRKLQKIYAEDSDLIVPFYCQDYLKKKWCGVELRSTRNTKEYCLFASIWRTSPAVSGRMYSQS